MFRHKYFSRQLVCMYVCMYVLDTNSHACIQAHTHVHTDYYALNLRRVQDLS